MLPRFGTPAQRASEVRLHTSLAASPRLLPARSSPSSLSHRSAALLRPLGRRCALKLARLQAGLRLQARPKVGVCPPHASAPPCDPRRALCRASARATVPTPLTVLPPHAAGRCSASSWRHTILLAATIYLLFELRTLVCGSRVVAAAAALEGDRRACRIDRPCLSRAAPWALERRLSAPTLAHRCSMVAPMRLASAAGQWAGASGRQQQQQRAARRSGVRAAAISSSRGQPRSSCRRPSGGEAAAHALPARHRVPWGRGRGRQLVWGARGIDLVARPARSAHAS